MSLRDFGLSSGPQAWSMDVWIGFQKNWKYLNITWLILSLARELKISCQDWKLCLNFPPLVVESAEKDAGKYKFSWQRNLRNKNIWNNWAGLGVTFCIFFTTGQSPFLTTTHSCWYFLTFSPEYSTESLLCIKALNYSGSLCSEQAGRMRLLVKYLEIKINLT